MNPARRGRLGLELASLAVAGAVFGRRRVDAVVRELRGYDDLASLPLRYVYDPETGGVFRKFALPIAYWGYRWNRGVASRNELSYAGRLLADRLLGPLRPGLDRLKLAEYVAIPHRGRTDRMDAAVESVESADLPAFVVEDPALALEHRRKGREVLLEIHPGLHMDAAELEDFALSNGVGLTYDTWHIRHGPERHQLAAGGGRRRGARAAPARWEREVERLLRVSGLVHFQPSRRKQQQNEMTDTLRGGRTELAAMVDAVRDLGYEGPVVVECAFPIRRQLSAPGGLASAANEIAHFLRENLPGRQSPPAAEETE